MWIPFVQISLVLGLVAVSAEASLPNTFNGWQTRSFQPVLAGQLAQFAEEDAALLEEYGFVSGERREYTRGDARLTATLWQMRDASGSFGLYTFYRTPEMEISETEDQMALGADRLLLRRGLYVLDARGAPLSADDARLLLAKVPSLTGAQALLPPLLAYLPQENRVANSTRYLLGSAALKRLDTHLPASTLGFELGAEVALAQYRIQGRLVRMVLVSYPTPQLASEKLRSFQQLPIVSETDPDTGAKVFLQRKGSLLCFVLDSPNLEAAEELLRQVRYQSVVTWNEYVPTHRDNAGNLILNAFLLAGLLLLFATVAGVSFGGIRIFTKKFIRVPIFDRPSQVEIIRLHLFDK
ncbi:MAG: hypothetical protein HY647_12335 [Acidobacteria bacterium]|nr:hypothetical protein [Acidobacteriota bacterium]